MAAITRDEPESDSPGSIQIESDATEAGSGGSPARLSLGNLPRPYKWAMGIAGILIVMVASLLIWEPGMDFPSQVQQLQTDGSYKSMEISRIISAHVKRGTTWLVRNWGGMFDAIDLSITYTMVWLEDGLKWIPWPAAFLAISGLAWAVAGWRLAAVSIVSLVLPGILFFGLGYTPAVIATVIYAVPPAIRLTNLGIRQVAPETVEAARSFGASPLQILSKVQIPMALPTIMAGINQTTMLALSMVVIASLVGASGLGEDVFRALQRQDPGNSVIAGMSIVLIAIIIDRLTQSVARSRQEALSGGL